jgi:hypothetical protein
MIKQYTNGVIMQFNENYNVRLPLTFKVKPRIWYNPDLKSDYFFIPGLVALILVMISALLTSITIAREKEMGTMEQILVSPIKPIEIILGKVLPYIGLAFLVGLLILILGIFMFKVPFIGSYFLLVLLYSSFFGIDDFHGCPDTTGSDDGRARCHFTTHNHVIGFYFPPEIHACYFAIYLIYRSRKILPHHNPGYHVKGKYIISTRRSNIFSITDVPGLIRKCCPEI